MFRSLAAAAALLVATAPFATALQTIYLATDSSSGQQGTYIAFFSDSDACQDGVRFGFLPAGFDNCDQDLTILGHENITFTGCQEPYTGYPGSLPTGVSDNGAPALTCAPHGNEDGPDYPVYPDLYESCQPGVSGSNAGGVEVKLLCS